MLRRLGEVPITPVAAQPQYEEPAAIPFDLTLLANQELLNQTKQTDGDGDFKLLAIAGTQTGAYSIRFRLPSGRWWPSAYAKNANVVGTAQFPVPLEPGIIFRAGEQIALDIKDTSGAGNAVQLLFIGVKLLKVR